MSKKHHKQQGKALPQSSGRRGGFFILPLLMVLALANAEAQTLSPEKAYGNAVPKLLVNITIDQLRSDYMEAFMSLYGDKGFQRLMKESRIYTQASYPLSRIDRASAIASLATGTIPYNHGIVGEHWLDRNTLRPVYCVDDTHYQGLLTAEKSSPQYMGVSTLGDELKVATEGKSLVYAIAPFRDAAILSAGHSADGALWINDDTGVWCSTSYYGQLPAWAQVENQYKSLDHTLQSTVWKPYSELVGNFSYFLSGGMKKPFEYKFKGSRRFRSFKTSGLVNERVSELAQTCLKSTALGGDAVPDYLSLTFYAGNYEHHSSLQNPMELQDIYVRLDKAIGDVIDAVDKKVGLQNALFVITSTGYVDSDTSDLSKYRIPSGIFYINRTVSLLNMYLSAIYGQGKFVEACYGSEIYLDHKLIEQKQLNQTEVLERVQDFLIQVSGVKDVFTSQRLQLGAWESGISRIRNSYNPKCSGDAQIQVANGWKLLNEETGEKQQVRDSYIPFPVFFFGCSVRPAIIDTPVTVDCIAPTLSKAMRIRAPNACSVAPLANW